MGHRSLIVLITTFCLIKASPLFAQNTAEEVESRKKELIEQIEGTQANWLQSALDKPELVSLGAPLNLQVDEALWPDLLRERLRLLARKTFSNRQWRRYWEELGQRSDALEKLYGEIESLPSSNEAPPSSQNRSEALRSWVELCAAKVKNQDLYLKGVGTERDAVEERLEAVLDNQASQALAAKTSTVQEPETGNKSALEDNEHRINRLQERLNFQKARHREAEAEVRLVEHQNESLEILSKALETDALLAGRENSIALTQARHPDAKYAGMWRAIAQASAQKMGSLENEVNLGKKRQRSLDVEMQLAKAQIQYREEKITYYTSEIEKLQSLQTRTRVFAQALGEFFRSRAWRVLGVLFFIWLLLKVVLRIIEWGRASILRAVTDHDPNTTSAAERRAETVVTVFAPVVQIAAYSIAVIFVLEEVGINTSPLLGSVAILGLAVSFGSQNLVRDLVNGFFILLENQFGVGDVVEIGGVTGTVETVNVRSTRLRQLDGTLRIIPNGEITGVANLTRDWSRVVCDVGVAYDSDISVVEKIVSEVGEAMYAEEYWLSRLLEKPFYIGVTQLGDSAVTVRLMCKTLPGEQWGVERELNRRLLSELNAAGIEIPFPQQVVWHKNEIATGTTND